MALIYNPVTLTVTASHYYVDGCRFLWNFVVAMGPAFWRALWNAPLNFLLLQLWVCAWARYWRIRIKLAARYVQLSWFWWLHMISVLWNLKPDLGGKDIHGSYWMWYRADMFELKRQFKELNRLRKEVGDSHVGTCIQFVLNIFLSHVPMVLLYTVSMIYFVVRIL